MDKTKKMPVCVSYGDYKTRANEFLVPNPDKTGTLIGIKSGKEFLYGAISFIGKEITVDDIIGKMKSNGILLDDETAYAIILDSYIDELYKYKISNVIEGGLDDVGNVILNKIASNPRR